jgi:ABC-type branched-subunit amino acid transport system ATPase component
MPLLVADGLKSGYGEMEILHGVGMRLERGEIVAVLGPNGAGKSTLIKTIFGLLKTTEGSVVFAEKDITGLAPEKLVTMGLSYVPQVNNVFPSLTVRENLEMGGIILRPAVWERFTSSKAPRVSLDERIEGVLELFPGLRDRLRDRTGTLSGGQQHMVAFAKSLILNPKVLLIDEPSAGLAPNLVTMVFDKIREIREHGTSIVLVEQRARRALALADRGYILDMGKNKYEDRGEALLRNPEIGRLYLGG